MGGGGGCVIETISLKAYQEKVGDSVMSVDTNTDTYTFVSSHTIKCYNIEFSKNDTLVIAEGANVILEGTLTIEKETVGIARITVNGSLTLKEGSAITFGTITRGASGIVVNSLNGLVMEGGDITIDTIKDGINKDDEASVGIAIVKDGSMIQKGGSIKIETMEKLAYGIRAYQGGEFAQEGGLIKINTMTSEKDDDNFVGGVVAYQGGRIIQHQGKIHGVTVRGNYTSLVYVDSDDSFDGSLFVQEEDGLIQVDNVENALGVSLNYSATFTQNGGQITISNVTGGGFSAFGVIVNYSATFTQNGGQITISNITSVGIDAVGVSVNYSARFTQNGGQITISNVTGTYYAAGVEVYDSGIFNQTGGQITISDVVGDNAFGVAVYSSATFNVKNLTVSGAEESDGSVGFVSTKEGGVVNSGSVRVYGTAIKYSKDGTSEIIPSPINNTGGAGDNTFFTGQTYYDTEAL